MDKAKTAHGTIVTTSEAGLKKTMLDGVSVVVHLDCDVSPYRLKLALHWPDRLPTDRIDFALVAPNDGHSFLCLFQHGTFGPKMIYSENCHASLAKELQGTNVVEIAEIATDGAKKRDYTCQLKHCLD